MSDQRPGMFVPALIGGAIAGILSGIPIISCLCCLWIIGGGMIAAYFLTKESPIILTAGDGAIVGIFSGIIAAIVELVASLPFHALNERITQEIMERFSEFYEEMPAGWESWFGGDGLEGSIIWTVLGLGISVIIFSALGALGGIIGVSLFGKKKGSQKAEGVLDVSKDTSDRQS